MLSSAFCPLAFALGVSAKTLTDVLYTQNDTLSILNSYLASQQALFDTLINTSNITILAPSNNALSALLGSSSFDDEIAADSGVLTALLNYHIFNGTYYTSNFTNADRPVFVRTLLSNATYTNVTGGQRVEGSTDENGNVKFTSGSGTESKVQTSNFNYTGGTVHVIDKALSVPSNLTTTLTAANLTAAVGAIDQAGVGNTLNQENEVTILAPSNAGFEAIGNLIAKMTAEDLSTVLSYHVIKGKVLYSGSITNGSEMTSQGTNVHFKVEGGDIFVNSAKVIQTNLLCNNGVVHIIDNVLNPENTTGKPNPTASTQAPAFSGASTTGGVPFTSGVIGPKPTAASAVGATATVTVPAAPATALAAPMRTGAVRVVALFGGAAVLANW
ncbi:FAS1 domain-containing protein [Podospora didyma]|uniref:FAS1 domain-containing protein n=1 Tax=Podospora didyma TaxID=330526 RepID=A0AAE0K5I0_9PEZI|nr:FAS1 domain-containing protein [Podospora didyma]